MTDLSAWDERWACPVHPEMWFAMGNGRRGGGNAIVKMTQPPKCMICKRETEQVLDVPIQPEDIQ